MIFHFTGNHAGMAARSRWNFEISSHETGWERIFISSFSCWRDLRPAAPSVWVRHAQLGFSQSSSFSCQRGRFYEKAGDISARRYRPKHGITCWGRITLCYFCRLHLLHTHFLRIYPKNIGSKLPQPRYTLPVSHLVEETTTSRRDKDESFTKNPWG